MMTRRGEGAGINDCNAPGLAIENPPELRDPGTGRMIRKPSRPGGGVVSRPR
jgi:hypothetical protein